MLSDIDVAILKYLPDLHMIDIDIQQVTDIIFSKMNNISRNDIEKRIIDIQKYRKQLYKLLELPQVKQRSVEWFEMRKNRLTASDLYDAIKGGSTTTTLAKKKANIVDNINYGNIPALKWGVMFESMAIRCYSQANNNIKIFEFGLVCDEDNEHFGASPDGINELGIMVEIKCPYSRKIIDDKIPIKYQSQIQGQLAVCRLKECDYIECEFITFEDKDEYLANIDKDSLTNHGIIAQKYADGEYHYIYSDPYLKPLEAIMNMKDRDISDHTLLYWKLQKINVQRVYFNAEEWSNTNAKIYEFWNLVEQCKSLPKEKKIQFIDED